MKKLLLCCVSASVLVLTGCGDSPSNLGSLAKEKLAQQKNAFESQANQNKVKNFISQSSWSPELKQSAFNAFNEALAFSSSVNPEYAQKAVESGEMGVACMFTLMRDSNEVDRFISNATNSISDNQARMALAGQLIEAKKLVATSVVTRENCK